MLIASQHDLGPSDIMLGGCVSCTVPVSVGLCCAHSLRVCIARPSLVSRNSRWHAYTTVRDFPLLSHVQYVLYSTTTGSEVIVFRWKPFVRDRVQASQRRSVVLMCVRVRVHVCVCVRVSAK